MNNRGIITTQIKAWGIKERKMNKPKIISIETIKINEYPESIRLTDRYKGHPEHFFEEEEEDTKSTYRGKINPTQYSEEKSKR